MFLSKVTISAAASRNPYLWHKALWTLFPNRPEEARNFLFRVERRRPGGDSEILLQSGWSPVSASTAHVLISKEVHYQLRDGLRLRFHLRANPVRTILDEQGRRDRRERIKRCRVPLIREQEQIDWLVRKLQPAAAIECVQVQPEKPLYFRKTHKEASTEAHDNAEKRVTAGKIQPVCFDGVLTVTDAAALTTLLEQGIGPAKAMGCGLLSLAAA